MAAHQAPSPWDSPGKNTGVGCHFLLQCMKVKSESEVAQLCPTYSDPMDCSPPGSSIHGIFQARVLEWGAVAFPVKFELIHFNSSLAIRWGLHPLAGPILLKKASMIEMVIVSLVVTLSVELTSVAGTVAIIR